MSKRSQRYRVRQRATHMIKRIKEEMPCEDCGVRLKVSLMHFHHRDSSQKYKNVSKLRKHASFRRLFDEIEKCDLLCLYCHMYSGRYHND